MHPARHGEPRAPVKPSVAPSRRGEYTSAAVASAQREPTALGNLGVQPRRVSHLAPSDMDCGRDSD